jgi:hypothetical protein
MWFRPHSLLTRKRGASAPFFISLYRRNRMNEQQRTEVEAAAFRRLIDHLDKNKQVQNIELMLLADFCRNCLSKWYLAEAQERDISLTDDEAREAIYKMSYSDWKANHQLPATEEQVAAFDAKRAAKQRK